MAHEVRNTRNSVTREVRENRECVTHASEMSHGTFMNKVKDTRVSAVEEIRDDEECHTRSQRHQEECYT